MAVMGATAFTLLDIAKQTDPNGDVAKVVEMMSLTNDILTDAVWKEGNLTTGHRITMRTGLPEPTWRNLNKGILPAKGTTAQIDETCAMLEMENVVDKDLLALNGNSAQYMLNNAFAAMEGMNQKMAETLFYGSLTSDPASFIGLDARYSTISGATNGQNIISAGGAGSDNTSIWLVCWGNHTVHGIFPKGSQAGLQRTHTGKEERIIDADGGSYYALVDRYQWKCGMALEDWRYVARIANIDVSNLVNESSAADLIKLMARIRHRIPTMKGVKPVFYANRTVFSMLEIQALNKSSSVLGVQQALTQFGTTEHELRFMGIPVRLVDAITNTEPTIS